MKPNKNRIYCIGCGKHKMLFEEKKKADNFIRFNQDAILEESGKAPVRSYYCAFCSGWHVTSNPSLEQGEERDKRDYDRMQYILDVKRDFASLSASVNQKLLEIQHAFFLLPKDYDVFQEYECCKKMLLELNRIHPNKVKAKLLQRVYQLSGVLSACAEVKSMDLAGLKAYIETLDSGSEKDVLIHRYALGRLIDLSLDESVVLYRSGQADQALKIKEDLLARLTKVEGEGRKIFCNKYADLIEMTFGKLAEEEADKVDAASLSDEYKQQLLSLINNLEVIDEEFENLKFDLCKEMVKEGIDRLSAMQSDKNVKLVLKHYRNWKSTLDRL